jgi:ribonuclease HII
MNDGGAVRPSFSEAGVDEVGRGALAGPVVAAAVVLDLRDVPEGIRDSKLLSAGRREALAREIEERALGVAVVELPPSIIDLWDIRRATLLAMSWAIARLGPLPSRAIVDGRDRPYARLPLEARIGADRLIPAVSAASIVAKVYRDARMTEYARLYPDYGFERHKGYPTADHRRRLARFGPCPIHRRSFAPVARAREASL